MKYIFIAFLIILGLSAYIFFPRQKQPITRQGVPDTGPTATPTPTVNSLNINYDNITYTMSWFLVKDAKKLSAYINSQKDTSGEFKRSHNCNALTNATFYDQDHTPLGLFISEGKTQHSFVENSLLNGVFSIHSFIPTISDMPIETADIAIQSGPRLYRNGEELSLNIHNDEYARRTIIAITDNQSILLFTIYNRENTYAGPLLQSLPVLLSLFEKQSDFKLRDALNLDGGSASAFLTPDIKLEELTTVGSYLCVGL